MTDHTLDRILGRRTTHLLGTMLLGFAAMAVGCSQSGAHSPGMMFDDFWSDTPSRVKRTPSVDQVSLIEPREHTIDDLLSFARLLRPRTSGRARP